MYTPRAFAQTDLALLDWLFVRDPFVTLISRGDHGASRRSRICWCCTGAMRRQ